MSAPIKPGSLIDSIEIDPMSAGFPTDLTGPHHRDLARAIECKRSKRFKPVGGTGFVVAIGLGATIWLAVFMAFGQLAD